MLLGDKQEAEKYKQYNAGHVPDLIKPGDSAWGTDWLGESKVPSPLRASAPPPGCQRMAGAPCVRVPRAFKRPAKTFGGWVVGGGGSKSELPQAGFP